MSEPRAVIGSDGKLLGITYGNRLVVQRQHYDDDEDGWERFLADVGRLLCGCLPKDSVSDHAKLLLKQDEERLAELRSQTPF